VGPNGLEHVLDEGANLFLEGAGVGWHSVVGLVDLGGVAGVA